MAQIMLSASALKGALYINKYCTRFNTLIIRSMSRSTGVNVGFIGLGNMGGHMATNLLKKVRKKKTMRK